MSILKTLLDLKGLRRVASVLILMLVDSAALLTGIFAAAYLIRGGGGVSEAFPAIPVLLLVWVLLMATFDLYNRAGVRRSPGSLVLAVLCWTVLLFAGTYLYPLSGPTAVEVLLAGAVAMPVAGILRLLYEWGIERIYRQGYGRMSAIVVGNAAERERVRRTMETTPGAYQCIGEINLGDPSVMLAELRRALDETGAKVVLLAGAESLGDEQALDLLRSAWLRGLRLRVVPGAVALASSRPVLSRNAGLPLLKVSYPRLDSFQLALKRALDVSLSLVGLAMLAPVFAVLALAVRLDSAGPAFFRQKRAGADERVFLCYKFRSMFADADLRQAEIERLNEADGPVFKIEKDPRITRVGGFLRRWSVDELPQLWNVLRGDMSLVGPRPLPLRDFERMGEEHKKRLAVVPGMTGYWQINGRSSLSFEEMIRLDLYYIENWSLAFDFKIILRTIGAVVRRHGAY